MMKKLSIQKFRVSKLNNSHTIVGGNTDNGDTANTTRTENQMVCVNNSDLMVPQTETVNYPTTVG